MPYVSKIRTTYNFSGQRTGFSSRFPSFKNVIISALSVPGYGILPSENTSQQVIPYDHCMIYEMVINNYVAIYVYTVIIIIIAISIYKSFCIIQNK